MCAIRYRVHVSKKKLLYDYFTVNVNPIRSAVFEKVNDPGGGGVAFKAPRSRKLLYQSSQYHACAFYYVFYAVAYLGFHFGGGSKIFWKSGGICMARSAMQRVAKPHVC